MFVITHSKIFLGIGAALIVGSMLIIGTLGLNLGIDFSGGALTEVAYGEKLKDGMSLSDFAYGESPEKVLEDAIDKTGIDLGGYSVRQTETDDRREGYIVRTRDLTEAERISIHEALIGAKADGEILRFTSIGPVIGEELKDKAIWAIGGVVLIIILYVAFAFSGVSYPVGSWVYGGITILALLHDVLVPTALMAILGATMGVEIDVLFVMAILAVLGYSVNDTIVVFDRVRENLIQNRDERVQKISEAGMVREEVTYKLTKSFDEIVGMSVSQTLMRSINTSATTLLALGALFFLGGDVTQNFALVLIAGVIAGTYSSICLANPLLAFVAARKAVKEKEK